MNVYGCTMSKQSDSGPYPRSTTVGRSSQQGLADVARQVIGSH